MRNRVASERSTIPDKLFSAITINRRSRPLDGHRLVGPRSSSTVPLSLSLSLSVFLVQVDMERRSRTLEEPSTVFCRSVFIDE